jgi:hypothetical protein
VRERLLLNAVVVTLDPGWPRDPAGGATDHEA